MTVGIDLGFTDRQRQLIKAAIISGRESMRALGIDPVVFESAFIKAGGVQVPGMEVPVDIQKRIESSILLCMADRCGPRYPFDDPEWAFQTVSREINRALSECYQAGPQHPDVAGYRIVIPENTRNVEQCKAFAQTIDYGLGLGIYPPTEIVILPPCCDHAGLEIVFIDELE